MKDSDDSADREARELIEGAAAKARAEQWSSALDRMEVDDIRDEESGFQGDSEAPPASGESSAIPEGLAGSVSSGATLLEGDVDLDSTQDLSTDFSVGSVSSTKSEKPAEGAGSQTSTWEPSGVSRSPATPIYRPTQRPPTAVLQVFDDNQEGSERVRIRQVPFDIGRQEGNLTIPHELQMSRRHLRIDRRSVDGQWHWVLRDLGSTNGTFVSARRVRLRNADELLLGADLVRFFQPGGPETAMLAKVAPGRYEEQVALKPGAHWIGSDASQCLPILKNNPFLDPRSLRIELDDQQQWRLYDCGCTNRVWVKIEEIKLVDGCCFQAGEQRFSFHLP
ncbi:FHA domain protein [Pirellulimonas nuda]|uniref:FHA domain protein n=1 Tax=Pirellulimonas nuda TaxID=2528009 RepID=A0A518DAH0_9BACT|nr:FHA domain-containing protein [Pirellulimonas nuda]QDU88481.1 FHA domain protein [Pirellulimonas nuda]